MHADASWTSLHPATLVIRLMQHGRTLLIPALLVLFAARGGRWELWLAVLFLPSMVFELYRFLTLRYRLGDRELIVRTGLLSRNERHVPFARIQSLDLSQNPLHRLFRVADVRVETASGGTPEANLRTLGLAEVERLREAIAASGGAAATSPDGAEGPSDGDAPTAPPAVSPPDEELVVELPAPELVRLGLTSFRGAAIIGILMLLAWEFDLWDRVDLKETTAYVGSLDGTTRSAAAAGVLAFLVVVVPLVSIGAAVLRFHGYRLVRRGADLHITSGLLTRRAASIPRRRIQLLSVRENPLHRLFGRVMVRAETAGSVANDQEQAERTFATRWFVPILPREELPRVLRTVRPDLEIDDLEWRPLAPKAGRRYGRKGVLVALLLTVVATALWPPWGLAAVAVAPLLMWLAHASARRSGYAVADDVVAFRSGILFRRVTLTFDDKAQTVTRRESPFDRRWNMATVALDTAGAGPAGAQVRIPCLEAPVARALTDRLTERARRVAFHW